MPKISIAFAISLQLWLASFGGAKALPPVVQLGGAIVAAVEQDAEFEAASEEQQRLDREWLAVAQNQFQRILKDDLSADDLNKMIESWQIEGEFEKYFIAHPFLSLAPIYIGQSKYLKPGK